MPTCGEMIAETQGLLSSWSLDEEQSTTLANDIAIDDLTLTATVTRSVATGLSPGILEIDQELMYCDTVQQNGRATITAWGRGYLSTPAAAHSAGARVISQPTFPRFWVMEAMNQAMQRIFPTVFAVRQVELTTTFPRITYQLPADAQRVLNIKWMLADGRQYWQGVRRWRLSPGGGTMFGDQGITVDVADTMMPGRPIQILYAAKPSPFVTEADDFVTVTGLPIGLRDVVTVGAAATLIRSQELSRLQTSSIEQQNRSGLVAPSAALTSSRFLEQSFQTRLREEERSLQSLYPPRITGGWL